MNPLNNPFRTLTLEITKNIYNELSQFFLKDEPQHRQIYWNPTTFTFTFIDSDPPHIPLTDQEALEITHQMVNDLLYKNNFVTIYICGDNREISFEQDITIEESKDIGFEAIPNKLFHLDD
jgi:hypothetical protein